MFGLLAIYFRGTGPCHRGSVVRYITVKSLVNVVFRLKKKKNLSDFFFLASGASRPWNMQGFYWICQNQMPQHKRNSCIVSFSRHQIQSTKMCQASLIFLMFTPKVGSKYVRCVGWIDTTGKIFWISNFPDTLVCHYSWNVSATFHENPSGLNLLKVKYSSQN